jgi:hypothetical protein
MHLLNGSIFSVAVTENSRLIANYIYFVSKQTDRQRTTAQGREVARSQNGRERERRLTKWMRRHTRTFSKLESGTLLDWKQGD